ncbi:hypothetical protein HSBGL_2909 [Halapricum desulfuricans]|uniref:Uncharacterized protein n=1 Tax=Halapricum desulfuricans TaxID=2841257 RepID=A0A897NR49_9EURY|nr:hypothetical protein [Halapricum desulfuricans]QSG13303.1 hypothetical protein HSBGL_2909 [Halapricum desulfuricans]
MKSIEDKVYRAVSGRSITAAVAEEGQNDATEAIGVMEDATASTSHTCSVLRPSETRATKRPSESSNTDALRDGFRW